MNRLPMRKIREALRLQAAGLTKRKIAASLDVVPPHADTMTLLSASCFACRT